MVNPYVVKQTKELGDNGQSKNDRKDPNVTTKPVIEGRYRDPGQRPGTDRRHKVRL